MEAASARENAAGANKPDVDAAIYNWKVGELLRYALGVGVCDEEVDHALEQPAAREALISLIRAKQANKAIIDRCIDDLGWHPLYNHGVSISKELERVVLLKADCKSFLGSASKPTIVLGPATSTSPLLVHSLRKQQELRIGVIDLREYFRVMNERPAPGCSFHTHLCRGVAFWLCSYKDGVILRDGDDERERIKCDFQPSTHSLAAEIIDANPKVINFTIDGSSLGSMSLPSKSTLCFALQFLAAGDAVAISRHCGDDCPFSMLTSSKVASAFLESAPLARSPSQLLEALPFSSIDVPSDEVVHEELGALERISSDRSNDDYSNSDEGVLVDAIKPHPEFSGHASDWSNCKMAAIRFARGSYFQDMQATGHIVERRQSIEDQYDCHLWSANELLSQWSTLMTNFMVLAISYAWGDKEHPDKSQYHLRTLASICSKFVSTAIFFDFTSLFQRPRDKKEEQIFRKALDVMEIIYAHSEITVVKLTGSACNTFPPYKDRGWPFFESSIANSKAGMHGVAEISQSLDQSAAWNPNETNLGRAPPLIPEHFDQALETKQITNNSDQDHLKKLYRKNFRYLVKATSLCFQGAGWGLHEARMCSIALPFFQDLLRLNLSQNHFSDAGVCTFCHVFSRLPELVYLDLADVDMSDEGAQSLVDVLPRITNLEELNVSQNKIRDVGAKSLELVLSTLQRFRNLALWGNPLSDIMRQQINSNPPSFIVGYEVPITMHQQMWSSPKRPFFSGV